MLTQALRAPLLIQRLAHLRLTLQPPWREMSASGYKNQKILKSNRLKAITKHMAGVCELSLLTLKHVYSFVNDSSVIHKNVLVIVDVVSRMCV